mmetsp:Transcript_13632/g.45470  ORF Transcript_13632/g.45470 Transcript_13632/m.45470 type:complete len:87 (-) Transcript_13632:457-717(-)
MSRSKEGQSPNPLLQLRLPFDERIPFCDYTLPFLGAKPHDLWRRTTYSDSPGAHNRLRHSAHGTAEEAAAWNAWRSCVLFESSFQG